MADTDNKLIEQVRLSIESFSLQAKMSPSLKKCYEYLAETSRSFAAVIQALDGELR